MFEHQNDRYCLIAIDSLGLTTALSNELRERVAEALDTTAVNVMLNFSHTHSAPDPFSPLNGQKYYSLLCDRVVSCVKESLVNLQPCLVSWSVGETDIGENRRDGCSVVDKRLGALQFVNATTQKSIVMLLRVVHMPLPAFVVKAKKDGASKAATVVPNGPFKIKQGQKGKLSKARHMAALRYAIERR
ncbi:hypothetical protein MHB81_00905 [Paenibacillus sp. FSL H7-0326]